MARRCLAILSFTVATGLAFAADAVAQVPPGLPGEWTATIQRGPGADSAYELHLMMSPDLLTFTVRGGPSDHAKGMVCSFGYGATYQIVARSGPSLSIVQSADSLKGRIHKPSELCYRHYESIGIILPQQITLTLSPDASTLTINDRVHLSRHVSRTGKVWSAWELNGFIDYYRGLMRIY
jgi:hypothetical protein